MESDFFLISGRNLMKKIQKSAKMEYVVKHKKMCAVIMRITAHTRIIDSEKRLIYKREGSEKAKIEKRYGKIRASVRKRSPGGGAGHRF